MGVNNNMKTMKSLIVAFALIVGLSAISHAGGRRGAGWKAYTVTLSSGQVFIGEGFLNSMSLSTGCTQNSPGSDWVIAFDTVAISTTTGLTWVNSSSYVAYFSTNLPIANQFDAANTPLLTNQLTPTLLFTTTTTAVSGGASNGYWSAGQAVDDYVEINNGLFILKSGGPATANGNCNAATVYYSK